MIRIFPLHATDNIGTRKVLNRASASLKIPKIRVRKRHYATDEEEYLRGVSAAAAGMGNHRGLLLAIWVVGFVSSMDSDTMLEIARNILSTAAALKHRLNDR